MTLLFKHKRVISFLLLVLFCILTMFTIPVLEANAFAIPVLPDIVIAILGALLTAGGITFASTQDMTVGVNGFYENSITKNTELNAFAANLIAAPVVDGVVQLTSDLSEGWSYFWEHASDYFGVETGVKPVIESNFDSFTGFSNAGCYYSTTPGYQGPATYSLGHSPSHIFSSLQEQGVTPISELAPLIQNKFSFKDDIGRTVTFGFLYCYNLGVLSASLMYSHDNFTSMISRYSTQPIGNYNIILSPCFPANPTRFYFTIKSEHMNVSLTDYRVNPSTLVADYPYGGSICPDYDTDSEDTLYTGQDVFGAFEDVLRKLGVGLGIGLNIGDVLADLEKGIGKDIAITPTQTDVIPDEIAKELDKPMPSPTPQPSASPSPSPSPPPDIPPDMLMPDVTRKFPFCLPFDLIHLVEVFNAEPEAPRFEIPIEFAFINYNDKFVLDFTEFEPVSKICRIFVTLEFIVFLILITRKITGG